MYVTVCERQVKICIDPSLPSSVECFVFLLDFVIIFDSGGLLLVNNITNLKKFGALNFFLQILQLMIIVCKTSNIAQNLF